MKKLAYIGVLIGAVLIGLGIYSLTRKPNESSTALSRPSSSRPTLVVLATDKWKDSGINVSKGQHVSISANGSVVWDQNFSPVGPNGTYPASNVQQASDFPLPSAGCGSLLMRIGTTIYPVGASDTVTAGEAGDLLFMVNDRYAYLFNNSGSFNVTVQVQ